MPGLVLQVLPRADENPARLGFTVTKKVGNAVVRNRTRRRLREAARLLLREMPVTGADLVLVGRDKTRSPPLCAAGRGSAPGPGPRRPAGHARAMSPAAALLTVPCAPTS